MKHRSKFVASIEFICRPGVQRRALAAAVVVGIVLNIINQGDALWSGTAINWLKLFLTFCVPYVVVLYGSVSAFLEQQIDQASQ